MIKHISLLFFAILLFSACDDTSKQSTLNGKRSTLAEKAAPKEKDAFIDIPPPPAPYTGSRKFCFEMQLHADSSDMTQMQFILDDNDSIHGSMIHSFTTRSSIRGSIKGIKEGMFLELSYVYIDSGIRKSEQLVLIAEDDKLYKKTGAMVLENGTMVLENPLTATLQLFLMQVNCK